MKPKISRNETAQEAQAAGLPIHKSKQVIAHMRHCGPDGKSVNWYTLEDGSEVMLDDDGKTLEKWPGAE